MKKILFGFALAALALVAAPTERASAGMVLNPGVALDAKHASEGLVTEVRGGRGRGHFGGRRIGGRHFGGRHFGGRRWVGRHYGWRPRVYAPRYYGYYGYPRRCRWVMTYDGPRRICRPRRIWW